MSAPHQQYNNCNIHVLGGCFCFGNPPHNLRVHCPPMVLDQMPFPPVVIQPYEVPPPPPAPLQLPVPPPPSTHASSQHWSKGVRILEQCPPPSAPAPTVSTKSVKSRSICCQCVPYSDSNQRVKVTHKSACPAALDVKVSNGTKDVMVHIGKKKRPKNAAPLSQPSSSKSAEKDTATDRILKAFGELRHEVKEEIGQLHAQLSEVSDRVSNVESQVKGHHFTQPYGDRTPHHHHHLAEPSQSAPQNVGYSVHATPVNLTGSNDIHKWLKVQELSGPCPDDTRRVYTISSSASAVNSLHVPEVEAHSSEMEPEDNATGLDKITHLSSADLCNKPLQSQQSPILLNSLQSPECSFQPKPSIDCARGEGAQCFNYIDAIENAGIENDQIQQPEAALTPSESSFYSAESYSTLHLKSQKEIADNSISHAISSNLHQLSEKLGLDGYVFIGGKWAPVKQTPPPATVETVVDEDERREDLGDSYRNEAESALPNPQDAKKNKDSASLQQAQLLEDGYRSWKAIMEWVDDVATMSRNASDDLTRKRVHFTLDQPQQNDFPVPAEACRLGALSENSDSSNVAVVGIRKTQLRKDMNNHGKNAGIPCDDAFESCGAVEPLPIEKEN